MRTAFLLLLLTVAALAACSGARDDVDLRPESDRRAASACPLAAGEDVCSRSFGGEDPEARAAVQVAASFAGAADAQADRVARACAAVATALGAPAGSTGDAGARSTCEAAAAALRAAGSRSMTVKVASPSCTPEPLPSCASADGGAPPTVLRCQTADVTVADGGATPSAAAAALRDPLGELRAAAAELASSADLASRVTASIDALAHVDAACVPSIDALIGDAVARQQATASALAAAFAELPQSTP